MAQYEVVADNWWEPRSFRLFKAIPQPGGFVTLERTYEMMEPQPDGSMALSCVLSVQEDGTPGWRPRGTAGPFELASPVASFYLYAPGIRLHGDLKLPVYPFARFSGFVL